jgi:quercetin dioxygenase-like cupin family protein
MSHHLEERAHSAHLLDPAGLKTVAVLGPTVQFLTPLTGGDEAPFLMRGIIPAETAVPLHRHPDVETFIHVSGELEAFSDAPPHGPHWIGISPGDIFHVPSNALHAFRNKGTEPAVSLVVTTARLGRFFAEVGDTDIPESRPPTPARLRHFLEVAARYDHWNGTPEERAKIGIVVG